MRFTQVTLTAILVAAVFAAPVPNEDLGVGVGGVVLDLKRDQATEDGGIGVGVGADVNLIKREEDLGIGIGASANIGKRE